MELREWVHIIKGMYWCYSWFEPRSPAVAVWMLESLRTWAVAMSALAGSLSSPSLVLKTRELGGCYSNLHFTSEDRRNLVLMLVKGGSRGTWTHERYSGKMWACNSTNFFLCVCVCVCSLWEVFLISGLLWESLALFFLPQLIFPRNTLMDPPRIMS